MYEHVRGWHHHALSLCKQHDPKKVKKIDICENKVSCIYHPFIRIIHLCVNIFLEFSESCYFWGTRGAIGPQAARMLRDAKREVHRQSMSSRQVPWRQFRRKSDLCRCLMILIASAYVTYVCFHDDFWLSMCFFCALTKETPSFVHARYSVKFLQEQMGRLEHPDGLTTRSDGFRFEEHSTSKVLGD